MKYHTSAEQNETLTRVGSGTPMGELLRRYWWPIGISKHLKNKPTMVRLLGQDLVLYRDARGGLGLLDSKCPHRRAPLAIGTTNAHGLRCRYHGWLINSNGEVLETPGEPEDSKLKCGIKHPSYPVRELGGAIFAYLGPAPAPDLFPFHMLMAEGERSVIIQGFNNCNFLQCLENGIDAHHVPFLHGETWTALAADPDITLFRREGLGIVLETIGKGRVPGEYGYRRHPVIMPGLSVGGDTTVNYGTDHRTGRDLPAATARWTVPIDDTHTVNFRIWYRPNSQPKSKIEEREGLAKAALIEPFLEYREGREELGYSGLDDIYEQDSTVFDGTGPIEDREHENLSVIDEGIVLLRELLLEQIEVVKRGGDPLGVFRNTASGEMKIIAGEYQWISEAQRAELLARK